ncbi:hypothetical protein RIF29_24032 [Crotalaria pallida]|uniref:Uncharacterized protein n=1 Tax=Crotalaria pallida TaxID=3830 RepID=A0AAN9EJT0_CROPI
MKNTRRRLTHSNEEHRRSPSHSKQSPSLAVAQQALAVAVVSLITDRNSRRLFLVLPPKSIKALSKLFCRNLEDRLLLAQTPSSFLPSWSKWG